jgi:uncharacterized membrane protein SirB2
MIYYTIKHIHVIAVIVSALGFVLRGWWMIATDPLLGHRLTRVVPHVVDTVLLLSAVALAIMIAQYPFVAGWVTAKVLGLLVYIGLGMLALRRGPTLPVRVSAWVAALVVYGWIVSVATSKQPWGFLAT